MLPAHALGEPPIPLLSPPPSGDGDRAPESVLRVQAALLRLLCLALYVAVMQALGYRFRRRRAPRAPRPAPTQSQTPTAPVKPHRAPRQPATPARTIDSGLCAALLADINGQVAAARPQPAPEPLPAPAPRPAAATPPPSSCPHAPPKPHLRRAAHTQSAGPSPLHPHQIFKNAQTHATPNRTQLVTIP